jgi:glycosidase
MPGFIYEFHISRRSRDKYKFNGNIFQTDGTAVIGSFHSARELSLKINETRDILNFPEKAAKASEIYAIGLMDEIFHHILKNYRTQTSLNVFEKAAENQTPTLSADEIEKVFEVFLSEFPPLPVYQKKENLKDYWAEVKRADQSANLVEEIMLLWVENQNPALQNYVELFPDTNLAENSAYAKFIDFLHGHLASTISAGAGFENIFDLLLAPSRAAPNSIFAQLEYIKARWGSLLGDLVYKLLGGLDFLREEAKPNFFGPGPALIPQYDQSWDLDSEKFSPDKDWMPSLVLIAKNAFVWLDQLSQKYERSIDRLDLIPDEELHLLSASGFTGLWLIGVWERSKASETIKKLCGNPEALASAYSLSNYQIAAELGGEQAYKTLQQRAWQHGIRLASDMVPNHMGIDSGWVYDHPDWFINLQNSPYPAYTFNGPNLSLNPQVEIKVEDHYFDRSDAAVVFKYHNHATGATQFIYHGNDGTSMPWNDTAQLNYLLPQVREAVYQTILSVARRFPIIRFDAAMTLAKKHYQRLWFPEPGTGGDIPSRAEYGMTKEQFDQIMPNEFWREVVDRLSADAPDTLLLAEAFWLMESYFVRTLGMHRVYNSAFMHMLRNEDNAGYRKLIKNTLDFDPQILKRFVNFMNNPDEKTAVEQFGKGDKYFGICSIMATLPGLPMFGHGQVEGFSEKYGMEFKKAYWDEKPDENLVTLHKEKIFPLLHRRKIFSEVENFHFFDFYTPNSEVVEDVFAYSNYANGQASLVVYHNKFAETQGWVNLADRNNPASGRNTTIFDALHLDPNHQFAIFKDIFNHLEYIRPVHEIRSNGLFFHLHAYETHVFIDFIGVTDDQSGSYRRICSELNGNGVPSIDNALKELLLRPILQPLQEILNRGYFDFLRENLLSAKNTRLNPNLILEAHQKLVKLARGISSNTGTATPSQTLMVQIGHTLEFVLGLPIINIRFPNPASKQYQGVLGYINHCLETITDFWPAIFCYTFLNRLGAFVSSDSDGLQSQSWFRQWQLSKVVQDLGKQYQLDSQKQNLLSTTVFTIIGLSDWYAEFKEIGYQAWLKKILNNSEMQQYLLINRFEDSLWFNKERFEDLAAWLFMIRLLEIGSDTNLSASVFFEETIKLNQFIQKLLKSISASAYKVENLLAELNSGIG